VSQNTFCPSFMGDNAVMLNPCSKCGHRLWRSVRAIGEYKVLLFMDDEEASNSYGKELRQCPTCGTSLPIVEARKERARS
jgi:hypothetical protein